MNGSRALVIAHEPDGPAGQIEVRLRERGWAVDQHTVVTDTSRPADAEPWPRWEDSDLLVVMGSTRSLAHRDADSDWMDDELDLLRRAHEADMPILGVCFGGQLMSAALGGQVDAAPVTEIGWFEIEPEASAPAALGPGPWFEWHHDRFTVPPGAELLASNDVGPQAFRIGRTFGTQFHPEVDVAHVDRFLGLAPPEYLAEHRVDRIALRASMVSNEQRNIDQCHALVDWFLDSTA